MKPQRSRHLKPIPTINKKENLEKAIEELKGNIQIAINRNTKTTNKTNIKIDLNTINLIPERRTSIRSAQKTRAPEYNAEANRLNWKVRITLRGTGNITTKD